MVIGQWRVSRKNKEQCRAQQYKARDGLSATQTGLVANETLSTLLRACCIWTRISGETLTLFNHQATTDWGIRIKNVSKVAQPCCWARIRPSRLFCIFSLNHHLLDNYGGHVAGLKYFTRNFLILNSNPARRITSMEVDDPDSVALESAYRAQLRARN